MGQIGPGTSPFFEDPPAPFVPILRSPILFPELRHAEKFSRNYDLENIFPKVRHFRIVRVRGL